MKKQSNKMDQVQVIQLHEFMKTVCSRNADGYAEYKEGWDDEKVTEYINKNNTTDRPYVLGAVQNLRRQVFGNFPRVDNFPTSKFAELAAQVEALAARINNLETYMLSRGYKPPQGRPQATPPSTLGGK